MQQNQQREFEYDTAEVEIPEVTNAALKGELVSREPAPRQVYIINPPTANVTTVQTPEYTLIDLAKSLGILALAVLVCATIWQLVTVILPAFFAGLAEGVKAGGMVAGQWVTMAFGGIVALALFGMGLAFLSSIRFGSDSESETRKKTVVNNYHNTTNFNSNNQL